MSRQTIAAVLARPLLWLEALRASAALAPRDWYKRPPFLPLPDPGYMSWRLQAAYGTSSADASPHDLVAYLEWRKRQRKTG